ncbi:hypothetical protein LTR66_008001 [Elasticomyces elasticus]|nr:hypothetical protein LTR66_008001 [Elasticomyces elasticus]
MKRVSPPRPARILSLSIEIRLLIYEELYRSTNPFTETVSSQYMPFRLLGWPPDSRAITLLNKQIHFEARDVAWSTCSCTLNSWADKVFLATRLQPYQLQAIKAVIIGQGIPTAQQCLSLIQKSPQCLRLRSLSIVSLDYDTFEKGVSRLLETCRHVTKNLKIELRFAVFKPAHRTEPLMRVRERGPSLVIVPSMSSLEGFIDTLRVTHKLEFTRAIVPRFSWQDWSPMYCHTMVLTTSVSLEEAPAFLPSSQSPEETLRKTSLLERRRRRSKTSVEHDRVTCRHWTLNEELYTNTRSSLRYLDGATAFSRFEHGFRSSLRHENRS